MLATVQFPFGPYKYLESPFPDASSRLRLMLSTVLAPATVFFWGYHAHLQCHRRRLPPPTPAFPPNQLVPADLTRLQHRRQNSPWVQPPQLSGFGNLPLSAAYARSGVCRCRVDAPSIPFLHILSALSSRPRNDAATRKQTEVASPSGTVAIGTRCCS